MTEENPVVIESLTTPLETTSEDLSSLPLVKVFCLTYNERDILEDFIIYHANLFGYDNIVLVDHSSTDEKVKEIYIKYIPRGVTVIYETDTDRGKHHIYLTKAMTEYKNKCQFMLPLDTDEFFFVVGSDPGIISKQAILDFFSGLPTNIGVFKLKNFFWSYSDVTAPDYQHYLHTAPIRNITIFKQVQTDDDFKKIKELPYVKAFFKASSFINIIHGNHDGQTTLKSEQYVGNCGFFHFHNTGVACKIEKAKKQMERIGFIAETDTINVAYTRLLNLNVNWGRTHFYKTYLLKIIIYNLYYFVYLHPIAPHEFEKLVNSCEGKQVHEIKTIIDNLGHMVTPKLFTAEPLTNFTMIEDKMDGLVRLTHVRDFLAKCV